MLVSEQQKLNAWRWLCREALAGNSNAVTVLVDWASPPDEDEEDDPLDRIATTFQWWIDEYARRPSEPIGRGVCPPTLPMTRAMCAWIEDIQEVATLHAGTEYGSDLSRIARCLQVLCRDYGRGGCVNPPVWPTQPVLESWIRILKTEPPSKVA